MVESKNIIIVSIQFFPYIQVKMTRLKLQSFAVVSELIQTEVHHVRTLKVMHKVGEGGLVSQATEHDTFLSIL